MLKLLPIITDITIVEGAEAIGPVNGARATQLDVTSQRSRSQITSTEPAPTDTKKIEIPQSIGAPSEKEYPPGFVFAPGFVLADRRGLVPYPGMHVAEGLRNLLTRKYDHDQAQRAYVEASQSFRGSNA